MIASEPGSKADPNFRLPKQTTTVYWVGKTYEKVTLTRQKNVIKILAKLYKSATSHSTMDHISMVIASAACRCSS